MLSGDGVGGLTLITTHATGSRPSGIRAADFDEDGLPDIIVSNYYGSTVGLFLSNP